MRSMYFMGNRKFSLVEKEIPKPPEGWVILRNYYCGVCGTDVHIYNGEAGSADVNPPVVLGHEYSGEVIEIGKEVKNVSVGDKVTVDPNIYCGVCESCRNGKKQLCKDMRAVGVTMDGGFQQYSCVPEAQLFKLNDNIDMKFGAMAEPLACCLHGIDRAGIKPGDNVCIVGGGAIGLINMQLAKLSGAAKVVLSEPNEIRRKTAEKICNVLTVNPMDKGYIDDVKDYFKTDGADVVIECAGNNQAVKSSFDLAGKGATILLFSVPKIESDFPLHLFDVYKKELTIKGSFVNPDTHSRAVRIINSGLIDFSDVITHVFPLEKLEDAVKMQMGNESIKVIVDCK
jgi:2-desacetyl-2-hydroxyethyl bacteriochlorophyllide A dehydrogenase